MNTKVVHSIGVVKESDIAWISLDITPATSRPSARYQMHLVGHLHFVIVSSVVGVLGTALELARQLLLLRAHGRVVHLRLILLGSGILALFIGQCCLCVISHASQDFASI